MQYEDKNPSVSSRTSKKTHHRSGANFPYVSGHARLYVQMHLCLYTAPLLNGVAISRRFEQDIHGEERASFQSTSETEKEVSKWSHGRALPLRARKKEAFLFLALCVFAYTLGICV